MTRFAMNNCADCCSHAAANTSARISLVMDTIIAVVSILLVGVTLLIDAPMT